MNAAEIPVTGSQPHFASTGLKTDSVIRLDKIATIIRTRVAGRIGKLPLELRSLINEKIAGLYRI